MDMSTRRRWPGRLFAVACMTGLSGCGTNFQEVLYQTAGAAGQTLLDRLLTDFANTLADSFDREAAQAPQEESAGDGGGETEPANGPSIEELTGDPPAGEQVFTSNGCQTCHCADAGGGCALDAPALVRVETQTLDDRLRGDAAHPGGKFDFTNQDIVDLQAYLGSLGG